MNKVLITLGIVAVAVGIFMYFSSPYRNCEEVSVGSGFSAGYDCGNRTIYIPKR